MNIRWVSSFLALGCALVIGAAGCTADAGEIEEGESEEAAASQDELAANTARLVGAYRTEDSVRFPSFTGIVFQQNGGFFADIDTGIRCIKAPCPSHVRLTGSFTATANYVRLRPAAGEPTGQYHGRYRYSVATGKLVLTRAGAAWADWTNTLGKANSYCAAPVECDGQSLIHPMCVGAWACESSSCSWNCGVTANVVFPADATKLVAESKGGGFTPPPPAGSNCGPGQSKYSLNLTTRKLTYEYCKLVDWETPLTKQSGTKTLTAAQLASVKAAASALKVTEEEICGADKSALQVTVTSTSQGTKTFKDSFYACERAGTYVENIDGVFSAFRDVVGE